MTFERAVAWRSASIWLLLRLVVAALLALLDSDPLSIDPRGVLILMVTVGVLGFVETKRRNEDVLLANLGTSRALILVLCFGPPLIHVLEQTPQQLSGGERRRSELALAMVRRPRCLIADEPLRGIDPRDAERLIETLRRMADGGAAVIVSGHEVRTLLDASDDVVWVTAGTSYDMGSPAQASAEDRFRREYLTGQWA
ncbi:hypothetical protein BH23GEM9_BH23GEM9_29680 [soil metagenome]